MKKIFDVDVYYVEVYRGANRYQCSRCGHIVNERRKIGLICEKCYNKIMGVRQAR